MPKYTFTCQCGNTKQQIANISTREITCDQCASKMQRSMPILSGQAGVSEIVDPHTGVKWGDNHIKEMDDRKRTYFWEVEVPRMVNSGVYSLETMLENRWVYFDDHGKLITRYRDW